MPTFIYENPLNILVVDDNRIDQMINSKILQKINKDSVIVTADDGFDAIQKIEQNDFDLVLLDIKMPGMDAFEFLDNLKDKKNPEELYILMVSSSVDPEDKERAKRFGLIQDFIEKPLRVEHLYNHGMIPVGN